jgi:hypothetical protein
MSNAQVQLPAEIQSLIGRQIAEGRVASEAAFILEAAARFADDLVAEDEIVAEAEAGLADAAAAGTSHSHWPRMWQRIMNAPWRVCGSEWPRNANRGFPVDCSGVRRRTESARIAQRTLH